LKLAPASAFLIFRASASLREKRGKLNLAPASVFLRWLARLAATVALSLLCACGNRRAAQVAVPAPPEVAESKPAPLPEARRHEKKPLYVETGIASWYGESRQKRRTANGEVYDLHALTAAHRTLPLNSVVRVTNLQTGHSAVVRITDRGPFIEGRMLDLSPAAAKQVDVWRAGTAEVKIEVIHAPASIEEGGRWCVQIGAFGSKAQAARLKGKLEKNQNSAAVLQFTGDTGEWLRVRVKDDDKNRAEAVLRQTRTPAGAAFLVRLD
jgi:rare lipoprotein A